MRLLFATAFLLAFPLGAAADHSETAFVSTGPAGGNGSFEAFFRRASQDGSKVFFETSESLVSADTDSQNDVYERSGTLTTLRSTGPDGGNGAFVAFFLGFSQDGSKVFFGTSESLVSADTDTQFDIYERSGTATTLLSTGPDGGNGAFSASFEGASQDGSKVFLATSESLVSADTDSQRDIYERRRSMPVGGGGGGGCGIGPELAALLPALGWLYCRRRRP